MHSNPYELTLWHHDRPYYASKQCGWEHEGSVFGSDMWHLSEKINIFSFQFSNNGVIQSDFLTAHHFTPTHARRNIERDINIYDIFLNLNLEGESEIFRGGENKNS